MKTSTDHLKEVFRSLKPKDGSTSAFLFALCCVIIATLIRLWLDAFIPGEHSLLATYAVAVLLAGVAGGVRAGTLACVASTGISWWFFLPVRQSFVIASPYDRARLVVFIAVGAAILWGAQRYRRTIESLSNEVALRKLMQSACRKVKRGSDP